MRPEIEVWIDMRFRLGDLEIADPLRLEVVRDSFAWGGFLRIRGEGCQGFYRVGGGREDGGVCLYICGGNLG